MPSRLTLALLGALILAVLAALWGWSDRAVYKAQAQTAEAKVARLEARIEGIQREAGKAQQAAQAAKLKMQEVLDAHPDWSRAAVPGPVADGLCGTLRCR